MILHLTAVTSPTRNGRVCREEDGSLEGEGVFLVYGSHDPLQFLLLLVEHHAADGGVDVRASGAGGQHDLHHQVHHHQGIALQLGLRAAADAELQLAPHAVLALPPGERGTAVEVQLHVAHLLHGVVHHLVITSFHCRYVKHAVRRAELKSLAGVEASAVDAGVQEHAFDSVSTAQAGDNVRTLIQLVLHAESTISRHVGELALTRFRRKKKAYVVTVAFTYSIM